MPSSPDGGRQSPEDHVEVANEGTSHVEIANDGTSPQQGDEHSHGLRDSKGWDGKLRVPKSALLSNPEALSDPEYSDGDNVIPGEQVAADEGKQDP